MSCNREKPHILIIPEDDANRQMANGFHLDVDFARQRQLQVLPEVGGWRKVMEEFSATYIDYLNRYPLGSVIMLLDFDRHPDRLSDVQSVVPPSLIDRAFVLGVWDEPEQSGLGAPEKLGRKLATDCRESTSITWDHQMLLHNASELERIKKHACEVLF